MSIIEKAIAKLHDEKSAKVISSPSEQDSNHSNATQDESSKKLRFNIESLSATGIVSPNKHAPHLADEFRRIKRPLLRNAFGSSSELVENGNVIMVTSSLPGEGKSFTAANLALSIALEKDYTVLLIDADFAMSKITQMFSLEHHLGLTDKLEDLSLDLSDLLIKTDFPGLSIIPAGKRTSLATELLSSGMMRNLITEISTRYNNRIIIFDSPPLLVTPESAVLAEQVGQIAVVVEANKTSKSALEESLGLLSKDKAIGLILNKVSKGVGNYNYGYYAPYNK